MHYDDANVLRWTAPSLRRRSGRVAPIPDLPTLTLDRGGSTHSRRPKIEPASKLNLQSARRSNACDESVLYGRNRVLTPI
jgi:hypothetical protein